MSALVAYKGLVLSDNIDDYPEGIIIPIDKPYRWTSADVIRKVKYQAIKHFHKKNLKVGHAGTLDPLATGVLLVCIGKATKLAESLQASPKQYLAGVSFGATTPSYDLEKEIDREYPLDGVSKESVEGVLPSFIGEQDQVAPLFSAKSVDGVRAYETARKLFKQGRLDEGSDILQASRITIYGLKLETFAPAEVGPLAGGAERSEAFAPAEDGSSENCATLGNIRGRGTLAGGAERSEAFAPAEDGSSENCAALGNIRGRGPLAGGAERSEAFSEEPSSAEIAERRNDRIHVADIKGHRLATASVRVDCSKGTYIRSLARDLGEALGSGAFLSSLRRTVNGGIRVEDALDMDAVAAMLWQEKDKDN